MPSVVQVSVTCATASAARRIARTLLQERVVACASWWPVRSVYRWRGRLEEAREVLLVLKTTRITMAAVRRRIRAMHGYELPVVVVSNQLVDPAVMAWVQGKLQ